MPVYECKNGFMVGVVDGDGIFTGEEMLIEKGTIWETDEDEDFTTDVRLCRKIERHDESILFMWIELDIESLNKDFRRVELNVTKNKKN